VSSFNTESKRLTPAYLKTSYSNDSLASSTEYQLNGSSLGSSTDRLDSSTEYHLDSSTEYHLDSSAEYHLGSSTEYHKMSNESLASSTENHSVTSSIEYHPSFEYNKKNLDHLLALLHSSQCRNHFCTILLSKCSIMRNTFYHAKKCRNDFCGFDDCHRSRRVLKHFVKCQDIDCAFCLPARLCLKNRNIYSRPRRRGIVVEVQSETYSNGMDASVSDDGSNYTI
jgi:hypothetical protein